MVAKDMTNLSKVQEKLASVQNILKNKLAEGEKLKQKRVREKQKEERVKDLASRRAIPGMPCFVEIVSELEEEMTLHDFVDPKRLDIDDKLPVLSLISEPDPSFNVITYQEVELDIEKPAKVKPKPKAPPVRKRKRKKIRAETETIVPRERDRERKSERYHPSKEEVRYDHHGYPPPEDSFEEPFYEHDYDSPFPPGHYVDPGSKRTFSQMEDYGYDEYNSAYDPQADTKPVEDIYSEFEKWYENSKAPKKKKKAIEAFIPEKKFKRPKEFKILVGQAKPTNDAKHPKEKGEPPKIEDRKNVKAEISYKQFNETEIKKEYVLKQSKINAGGREGDAYAYLDSNHGSRSKLLSSRPAIKTKEKPKLQSGGAKKSNSNEPLYDVSINPAELYRKRSPDQQSVSVRPKSSNFVYTRSIENENNNRAINSMPVHPQTQPLPRTANPSYRSALIGDEYHSLSSGDEYYSLSSKSTSPGREVRRKINTALGSSNNSSQRPITHSQQYSEKRYDKPNNVQTNSIDNRGYCNGNSHNEYNQQPSTQNTYNRPEGHKQANNHKSTLNQNYQTNQRMENWYGNTWEGREMQTSKKSVEGMKKYFSPPKIPRKTNITMPPRSIEGAILPKNPEGTYSLQHHNLNQAQYYS